MNFNETPHNINKVQNTSQLEACINELDSCFQTHDSQDTKLIQERVYQLASATLHCLESNPSLDLSIKDRAIHSIQSKEGVLDKKKQAILDKKIHAVLTQTVSTPIGMQKFIEKLIASLKLGHCPEQAAALEKIHYSDDAHQELYLLLCEPEFLLSIVEHGDALNVDFLIGYFNLDPNTANSSGKTPLHLLLSRPDAPKAEPLLKTLAQLVKHGANVNQHDRLGLTPLHYAVANRNLEGTKALYEYGANHALKDKARKNPIEHALCTTPGDNPALNFLMMQLLRLAPKEEKFSVSDSSGLEHHLLYYTAWYQTSLYKTVSYENMPTITNSSLLEYLLDNPYSYLTRQELNELELQELCLMSPEVEHSIFLLPHIAKLIHTKSNLTVKQDAYHKKIALLENEISDLNNTLEKTTNEQTQKSLIAARTKKMDSLEELKKDAAHVIRNEIIKFVSTSANLTIKGTRSATDAMIHLGAISPATQNTLGQLLASSSLGVNSMINIYKNRNDQKNFGVKAAELQVARLSLEKTLTLLNSANNHLPAGFEKKLVSLKIKQIDTKLSNIVSEIEQLEVKQSTVQYSNYGHYSALLLLTASALYGGSDSIVGLGSFVSSAAVFAPLAVGGFYACYNKAAKWEQYTDTIHTTLDTARAFKNKQSQLSSNATEEKKQLGQPTSNLDLKLKATRNLEIEMDELNKLLNELNSHLTEKETDRKNHEFLRDVLSESGIDLSTYEVDRARLILTFLTQ